MHLSISQAFKSSYVLNRSLGVKKRSRTRPTWFSTWPFSQPTAGVQATGSTRWCEHIWRKRRLYWRSLPTKTVSTAVFTPTNARHLSGVVVDSALAGALEECERPVVRVEHHLLGLARIGAHEHHPAVAETDMRDFQSRRRAVHHHDLVAPVELVGFARRKRQRNVGARRLAGVFAAPSPGVASHGVVAALVAKPPQLLEQPDQRQTLARRRLRVLRQHPIDLALPATEFGARLNLSLVGKRRLPRTNDPANRIPRDLQIAGNLPNRFPAPQMRAPYPANRLHNQHPPPPASESPEQPNRTATGGSILHADSPD